MRVVVICVLEIIIFTHKPLVKFIIAPVARNKLSNCIVNIMCIFNFFWLFVKLLFMLNNFRFRVDVNNAIPLNNVLEKKIL